jgi:predicted RNA-binding Zn-ribbon protein involved in translation (DUF1610 family)
MEGWHCLGCGTIWYSSEGIKQICCPYCHDQFISGGIIQDIPTAIDRGMYVVQNASCGHVIETDLPGDIKYCPMCGVVLDEDVHNLPTLKKYQLSILKNLGMRP